MIPLGLNIDKAFNGYIVKFGATTLVFRELQEVMEEILHYFEGLAPTFNGDGYGSVIINRGEEDSEADEE